jgi:hypothetical protein
MIPAGYETEDGMGLGFDREVLPENNTGHRNRVPSVTIAGHSRSIEDGMEDGEIQDEDGEVFEELEEESFIDVDSESVELADAVHEVPLCEVPAQPSQEAKETGVEYGFENGIVQDEIDSPSGTDSEDSALSACALAVPRTVVGSSDGPDQRITELYVQRGYPSPVPNDTRLLSAETPDASMSDRASFPSSTQLEPFIMRHPYPFHPYGAALMLSGPPPPPPQLMHIPPPHLLPAPPLLLPGVFEREHSPHEFLGAQEIHRVAMARIAQHRQMINGLRQMGEMLDGRLYASNQLSSPSALPLHYQPDHLPSRLAERSNCETTHFTADYFDQVNTFGTRARSHGIRFASDSDKHAVNSPHFLAGSPGSFWTNHDQRSSPASSVEGQEPSQARGVAAVLGNNDLRDLDFDLTNEIPGGAGKQSEVPLSTNAVPEQSFTPSSSEGRDVAEQLSNPRRPRIDLAAMKLAALKTLKNQSGPKPKPRAPQCTPETEKIVFSCDEENSDSGIEAESDDSSSDNENEDPGNVKDQRATVSVRPHASDGQAGPISLLPAYVASADPQAVKRQELEELRKRVKLKEEELAIKALQYGALLTCGHGSRGRSTPPSTKDEALIKLSSVAQPSSAQKLIQRERQNLARKIAELERMRRDALEEAARVPSDQGMLCRCLFRFQHCRAAKAAVSSLVLMSPSFV